MMSLVLYKPVDNQCVVTQTYAEHLAYKADNCLKYYDGGIDYAPTGGAYDGHIITAAAGGKVTKISTETDGFGLRIEVSHDEHVKTLYAHLACIKVTLGQQVTTGQPIAVMGWSGNVRPRDVGGTHLHWGLYVDGKATDPAPYMAGQAPKPVGYVRVLGDGTNLRNSPNGAVIAQVGANTQLELNGSPVEAGIYQWLPVRVWVANQLVEK